MNIKEIDLLLNLLQRDHIIPLFQTLIQEKYQSVNYSNNKKKNKNMLNNNNNKEENSIVFNSMNDLVEDTTILVGVLKNNITATITTTNINTDYNTDKGNMKQIPTTLDILNDSPNYPLVTNELPTYLDLEKINGRTMYEMDDSDDNSSKHFHYIQNSNLHYHQQQRNNKNKNKKNLPPSLVNLQHQSNMKKISLSHIEYLK